MPSPRFSFSPSLRVIAAPSTFLPAFLFFSPSLPFSPTSLLSPSFFFPANASFHVSHLLRLAALSPFLENPSIPTLHPPKASCAPLRSPFFSRVRACVTV